MEIATYREKEGGRHREHEGEKTRQRESDRERERKNEGEKTKERRRESKNERETPRERRRARENKRERTRDIENYVRQRVKGLAGCELETLAQPRGIPARLLGKACGEKERKNTREIATYRKQWKILRERDRE